MRNERALLVTALFSLLVLLVFGTFLFQVLEHWRALDAFYFTAMTMLTVGYGDVAPHTDTGKVAAVIFAFVSVGVALYSVNLIARLAFHHRLEHPRVLRHRKD